MTEGPGPQDPMTALTEGAAQQHEMFLAWMAVGFTEDQALELLKTAITAAIRKTL
jgi:hypothetical protein